MLCPAYKINTRQGTIERKFNKHACEAAMFLLPVNTPGNKAKGKTKQASRQQGSQNAFFGNPHRNAEENCIPKNHDACNQEAGANEKLLFKNFYGHNPVFFKVLRPFIYRSHLPVDRQNALTVESLFTTYAFTTNPSAG